MTKSITVKTPAELTDTDSSVSESTVSQDPTRTSMSIDGEGGLESLFSLHEVSTFSYTGNLLTSSTYVFPQQHPSTRNLRNVKYVREFPKAPAGSIQLFDSVTQENDRKLSTLSPVSFPSRTMAVQNKR
ncbi:hypothetical protein GQ600_23157 [Phytophthora cactorum]|nr:hypothetical protein GQ600_23157 [Phytophthora cactorum]